MLERQSDQVKLTKYTRNECRRCETTLQTSGEDLQNTLETSGEDVKLHSKRVGKFKIVLLGLVTVEKAACV